MLGKSYESTLNWVLLCLGLARGAYRDQLQPPGRARRVTGLERLARSCGAEPGERRGAEPIAGQRAEANLCTLAFGPPDPWNRHISWIRST